MTGSRRTPAEQAQEMRALIRNTFSKQNTCVAQTTQPMRSPPAEHASKSLAQRQPSQLYRGRHDTRPTARVEAPPTLLLPVTTTTSPMMLTSKQSSLLIALFSLLLLLVEVHSITPEDVRFATTRCQNDSTADPAMRLQWSMRMFPDNHETHCYVKCLLSKLGLINLKHRGLDGNKFIQPLESEDIEITEHCYMLLEDVLNGTCVEYYRKWVELRQSCMQFFYISLFEDSGKVEKFDKNSNKPVGETASEYCNRDASGSGQSTELTSAQSDGDDMLSLFKSELECVFRHIRYFDAYGRLDEQEIRRSFNEAKSDSAASLEVLSKCAHQANALYPYGPRQMAYELYQCLLKKLDNFRLIYTQRDKISRYY